MSKRYVSFILGSGRYCVPVDMVLQIVRPEGVLEVPTAPPFVTGVVNLRGDVIPVVSLKSRLGVGADPDGAGRSAGPSARASSAAFQNARTRERIIVTRVGNRNYGLAVDEVREIIDIDEASIRRDAADAFGKRAELILGVAQREDTLFLILDLPRVLGAGRELSGAEQA